MENFELKKHDIHPDKILEPHEMTMVGHSLKNQGRLLIMPDLDPAKNDYNHDFDRGTVHYTRKVKNYSFHKVIVPDGTIIKEHNFTQLKAGTKAIFGKNLTFIECNLVNNLIDDTWIIYDCNTSQGDKN